jgi:anti-sigma factor RsiW
MAACELSLRVHAYHDGELPEAQRREVEEHLSACPACAAELEQLRGLSQALSTAVIPRVSPSFVQHIQSLAEPLEQVLLFRFGRRMTAAAAAMVLLATGYWVMNQKPPIATPVSSVSIAAWEQQVIYPDPRDAVASSDSAFDDFLRQDLSGGRP